MFQNLPNILKMSIANCLTQIAFAIYMALCNDLDGSFDFKDQADLFILFSAGALFVSIACCRYDIGDSDTMTWGIARTAFALVIYIAADSYFGFDGSSWQFIIGVCVLTVMSAWTAFDTAKLHAKHDSQYGTRTVFLCQLPFFFGVMLGGFAILLKPIWYEPQHAKT